MKTTQRVLALLLAALLLAPGARAAFDGSYSDVPEDHWACAGVRRAAELGLMQGVGDGRFGLGEPMTRAAYATMLCRLFGWEMLTPETGSFTDNQDRGAWYYSAIETAYAHGALFVQGKTCKPNETLLREELAAMNVRALGYTMLAGTLQGECPFSDVTTNRGYVTLAYRLGLMEGVGGGQFQPRESALREQAAVVLLRLYDRMHAEVTLLPARTEGVEAKSITGTQGSVPLSPRAPLESICVAAAEAGAGGTVILNAVPLAQNVRGGVIGEGRELSRDELAQYLSGPGAQSYRSARYESSYLVCPEKDGSSTVIWYETESDLDKKIDLCRLLGAGAVYIERGQ